MRTTDWGVAVDANSSIKSAKDLKGKTIGVYNQGVLWLNELLITSGPKVISRREPISEPIRKATGAFSVQLMVIK